MYLDRDIYAQLIGVNNLAKVEEIKEVGWCTSKSYCYNRWKKTNICYSLYGQVFYINKENEFNRWYYGDTQKELKKIERKYRINKVIMKEIDKKVLNNILTNMEKVYDNFPQIRGNIKEIQSISHLYGGLNIAPDLKDDKYIL